MTRGHSNYTSGLILSVQSNQFVQSKTQIVQSNTRNCAVQNLHDFKLQISNRAHQFTKLESDSTLGYTRYSSAMLLLSCVQLSLLVYCGAVVPSFSTEER